MLDAAYTDLYTFTMKKMIENLKIISLIGSMCLSVNKTAVTIPLKDDIDIFKVEDKKSSRELENRVVFDQR